MNLYKVKGVFESLKGMGRGSDGGSFEGREGGEVIYK